MLTLILVLFSNGQELHLADMGAQHCTNAMASFQDAGGDAVCIQDNSPMLRNLNPDLDPILNQDPNLYQDPMRDQYSGPKNRVLDTLEFLALLLILVVDQVLETRARIRRWFGQQGHRCRRKA